jgi:dienelactone hydrolase
MSRFAILLAWFALAAPVIAQAPAFVARTQSLTFGDTTTVVDIYQPAAGPVAGTAIIAHGFTRSRERHRNLGRALAAAGVVALVPDLPYAADPWRNGQAIVALAHALETGEMALALPLPRLQRSSLVLIGTSAGGFATVLAAAELPGIAGWIGLDPVDRTGAAKDAAARVTAPVTVFYGDASNCNLFGSARGIGQAAPALAHLRKFEGASHCDFESPTNRVCTVLCGGGSTDRQREIVDETVAAAREFLAPRKVAPPSLDMGPPLPDVAIDAAE